MLCEAYLLWSVLRRCSSIGKYHLSYPLNEQKFTFVGKYQFNFVVFNCLVSSRKPNEEAQGWMGYVGLAIKQSASYLPSQVTEMFNQGRDHATARLPFSGLKNVCALAK